MLMQRKVTGGSLSFYQNWVKYRDGFGAAAGSDNYWLGLEKIYRLMQMGSTRLRIEVKTMKHVMFKVGDILRRVPDVSYPKLFRKLAFLIIIIIRRRRGRRKFS